MRASKYSSLGIAFEWKRVEQKEVKRTGGGRKRPLFVCWQFRRGELMKKDYDWRKEIAALRTPIQHHSSAASR